MTLQLFSFFRSTATWRVRIALNLKAVPHDILPVNVRTNDHNGAAYRDENPQGLVPAMRIGDQVVAQSLALLEYLEATYPDPPLLPADPVDKAQVRSWAALIACDIHPLNNRRVVQYLTGPLHLSEDQVQGWLQHWIHQGFAALETQLSRRPPARFLFGDRPTLADLCLVPQMENARRVGTAMDACPTLRRVDAELSGLDAFIAAHPHNQVDRVAD